MIEQEETKEDKKGPRVNYDAYFDYQGANAEEKARFLEQFDLIKTRKVGIREKPVAIIYNPVSGKKVNFRPTIEERFKMENIEYEFLETEKYFDTFMYAKDLDIDKYSVLVVVGGDGSYHEVINGMLAREDGRKIPICPVPNGSGNDLCSDIGIWSVDIALDYICKGECTGIDTVRCLLDHETEDTLPDGEERWMLCRHMDVSAAFAISGKVAEDA